MRINKLETFLTNAGLRNYLFVRLTTDNGLTGLGEATLEWQEKTVQTLIHEWIEDRVLGQDPLEVERLTRDLIRDQYQGGSTIMTAISSIEIACWDLIGKQCGQPVYKLLGGQAHEQLPAYANGWYGGARTPKDYAAKACEVVKRGYPGMKFDPFGTAWQTLTTEEYNHALEIVRAVRESVGDGVQLMIEVHGRLSVESAITFGQEIAPFDPAWYEEPVTPNSLEQLLEVKKAIPFPIAAGERLYTLEDFQRLIHLKAADIIQMDPSHCGGLAMSKTIAALAKSAGLRVSPHCSIGPVALCAALHFDWATPNAFIQENFAEYDVPWRNELVHGWTPIQKGQFVLPDKPGLGLELNVEACLSHPYRKNSFPSLWDAAWIRDFTKKDL